MIAAPQGSLGRNRDRIVIDLESRNPNPVEMRRPGGFIGEEPVGMFGQAGDYRPGERTSAHIGQRLGIDHIILMAGAEPIKEVAAALPILVQKTVPCGERRYRRP